MAKESDIGWCDSTWNPATGCTKVSPGCAYCYAEEFSERFRGVAGNYFEHGFDLTLRPHKLEEPLKWKPLRARPRRIFVNSMSDLFHEDIPDEYIDKVFAVMSLTPQHVYQVLTKRPERMREYLRDSAYRGEMVGIEAERESGTSRWDYGNGDPTWRFPLPNVWLGVTCENQHWADQRIPLLLDTPAAVRFVSVEPMLGPVDLVHGRAGTWDLLEGIDFGRLDDWGSMDLPGIGWVIVGAESGRNRRPFDQQWARDLAAQCQAAGVPVFCKQGSALRPGQPFGDAALDALKQFPEANRG